MKNLIELLKFSIFLYWSYMVVVVPTSIQLIGMHLFFNIKDLGFDFVRLSLAPA